MYHFWCCTVFKALITPHHINKVFLFIVFYSMGYITYIE
jgi:hypothetical protein